MRSDSALGAHSSSGPHAWSSPCHSSARPDAGSRQASSPPRCSPCRPVPTGQFTGNGATCMDDSAGGTADGNPVIIYDCTGNANQHWTRNADGTVRTLGKCLTAKGSSAGSAVVLSTCTGSSLQQWTATPDGTLTTTGLCLDVTGGSTANGTALELWTCGSHQANQYWSLPV
ncbi:RICIN domain-containing protein [Kitasatospora sp. NPDC005856]|uniref:RICIN domain-containing protein n=1 Tax=Kitasatospora sp. NPDC005856 TaxID=3154566 RepID=UPI0033CA84E1